MKRSLILAASVLLASVAGCSDDTTAPSKAGTFSGTPVTVGNGTARTWVTLDNDGNPTSIGITLTAPALENLPSAATMSMLTFPTQAGTTAYKELGLDWNPGGHPPPGIYDTPHFDFHFYHNTHAERMAISPLDSTNGRMMPDPAYVPTGYFTPPPGEIVPEMGIHWVDPTSPELSPTDPKPFDKTFIYGFWAAEMIFSEPMVTKEYLESKPNVSVDLKLPARYPKAGVYYATKYSVRHNSTTNEYIVSLDSLVKR